MRKLCLIGLSALALAACEDSQHFSAQSESTALDNFAPAPYQKAAVQNASRQLVNERTEVDDGNKGSDPAGIYLAYRYGYGLVMPSTAVKSTADKHMQICRDAGPSKCQITGSNANNYSDEDIRANLSLRAEPKWLESFVADMKTDIAEVKGRVESENTAVEDLTRAILDTDARLKAKRTLRTRLEALLATRDAKLPDLLTLERELARVQGEIESATANLKALRARVSMSVVTINYSSERAAISRSSLSPIGEALKDFVGILSASLAAFIRMLAVILPWLFLLIPGFYLSRKLWRKRREKKAEAIPKA